MNNNQLFETVDHVTYRVTSSAVSGLILGGSFATLKGLPLMQTTLSMTSSFALASTACFIPERIFYHSSFYFVPRDTSKEFTDSSEKLEKTRLFVSHGLGGIIGGGVAGGIFKGKPLPGIMLLSPLMLGAAYSEIRIQEYKRKRIKELQMEMEQKSGNVGR
mmetsp:Transcript_22386/g.33123  ORF Transcript_22386/g.33123 Transcript_22386/m.33123 type:complete len:161 (-) Transcript_22386:685-1167(-)